jgi:hypothetical protein
VGKLRKYTLENTEGAIQMDNPEKLATLDTQDEEKQNKNTAQYAYIDKRLYHLEAPIITIHICSFVGEVFMAGIAILMTSVLHQFYQLSCYKYFMDRYRM